MEVGGSGYLQDAIDHFGSLEFPVIHIRSKLGCGGTCVSTQVVCPTRRQLKMEDKLVHGLDCYPENDTRRESLMKLCYSLSKGVRGTLYRPKPFVADFSWLEMDSRATSPLLSYSDSADLKTHSKPFTSKDDSPPKWLWKPTLTWNGDSSEEDLKHFIVNMVNGRQSTSIDSITRHSLPDSFGVIFKNRFAGTNHAFILQRSSDPTGTVVDKMYIVRSPGCSKNSVAKDPQGESSMVPDAPHGKPSMVFR